MRGQGAVVSFKMGSLARVDAGGGEPGINVDSDKKLREIVRMVKQHWGMGSRL